jgi:hypothetical protein
VPSHNLKVELRVNGASCRPRTPRLVHNVTQLLSFCSQVSRWNGRRGWRARRGFGQGPQTPTPYGGRATSCRPRSATSA